MIDIKDLVVEGFYTPYNRHGLKIMLSRGVIRGTEIDGMEKRCSKCNEWLPFDTEFFYTSDRGVNIALMQPCLFCISEKMRIRRSVKAQQE